MPQSTFTGAPIRDITRRRLCVVHGRAPLTLSLLGFRLGLECKNGLVEILHPLPIHITISMVIAWLAGGA